MHGYKKFQKKHHIPILASGSDEPHLRLFGTDFHGEVSLSHQHGGGVPVGAI